MSERDDLGIHMEGVARLVLGDPNPRLSSKTELRFGSNGSVAVDLQSGTWFDHELEVGGGVLKLIETRLGLKNGGTLYWMREHGFALRDRDEAAPPVRLRVVDTFDYRDEHDELVFQVVRYEPKTFRQRRRPGPDDDPAKIRDGWVWSVKGLPLIPYRLPELIESLASGRLVFLVEGERKVDALRLRGIPATCNPMGAGKWSDDLTRHFASADLVVLPDNDDAGRKHRDLVAARLAGTAQRVRCLDLPGLSPKGDVLDWLDAGGSAEELYHLVETAALRPGEEPFRSRYGAIFFADLDAAPARRDWIVKGVLEEGEFSVLWGFSGAGKSFLMLDMGLSISHAAFLAARGEPIVHPWFGHRVFPGGVAYLAPEGGKALAQLRTKAWRKERDVAPGSALPFVILPAALDLRSLEGDTAPMVAELKGLAARMCAPLKLVIVDTLAQALAGGNENASEDMGAFIRNCQTIHRETGAHVVAVHHAGLDRTRERGHTSLRAACETSIEVLKPEGGQGNEWVIRKQKDGEEGVPHPFRLQSVTLGTDEDGDAITSCVVAPSEAETRTGPSGARKTKALSARAKIALRVLRDTMFDHGEAAPAALQLPYGLKVVPYTRWRAALVRVLFDPDENPSLDAVRQSVKRVGEELLAKHVIGRNDPYVWIAREPSL